jgi:hypothetical protein
MTTGMKETKLINLSEYSTSKNKQWQTKSVEIKPLNAPTTISVNTSIYT